VALKHCATIGTMEWLWMSSAKKGQMLAPRRRLLIVNGVGSESHEQSSACSRFTRIETIPDLKGFAAANGLGGKSDDEVRAELGDKFPRHIYHSIICIGALVPVARMAVAGL
jgi:hypothetical protein